MEKWWGTHLLDFLLDTAVGDDRVRFDQQLALELLVVNHQPGEIRAGLDGQTAAGGALAPLQR